MPQLTTSAPFRASRPPTTKDCEEVHLLTVTRTYAASLDEVWAALTSPERIERWLMPISGDLQLGGAYQLEGQAGGEILTCDPPHRLGVTWDFEHLSWVNVTLTAADDGTTLVLEHIAPSAPDHWDKFGPGAVGIGWELMLMGLAEHLAAPEAPRPSPEELPDLTCYMADSCAAWRDSDVAAGTDPKQAHAAAQRCLAAYTGAPE